MNGRAAPCARRLCCLLAACSWIAAKADGAWADSLSHGSVKGFPSYDEANKLLKSWLRQYPESFKEKKIGASFQKRPIYAYILGRTSSQPQNCPQVLLTSLMHAREPSSLTVLLYFAGRLLELDGQGDPQAVYLLEHREIWLVPFVNPDGYIENQHLRNKVIRKNRRPTCGRSWDSGVDINRNFAVHWSKEFAKCNEEYQGTQPFSEPETQAIKQLCEDNHFKAAVNFHSFGGMLTHPFNWAQNPQLPPDDQLIYDEIAKVFGWKKFGPAIKTVGYTAPGESDDWMYGAQKILSMSPEVGPESGDFWPPAREIPGINQRNFQRTLYVVKKAGLELAVEWAHRPTRAAQLPGNATQLAGGPPSGELELRLGNRGLTASAGQALGVAVAGAAARPGLRSGALPALVVLQEAAGSLPASLLPPVDGSGVAVTFSLQPLPRRSMSHIRLLVGRNLEPVGGRSLRLCAAEISAPTAAGAAAPHAACHCVGPAALPAAGSSEEATARPPSAATLVLSADERQASSKEDQALCRAAAGAAAPGTAAASAAAPAPARPTAAAAASGTAAAGAGAAPAAAAQRAPAAAPSKGSGAGAKAPTGLASQAITAAATRPTAATAAAVLDPAFEATNTGEGTASLAVLLFGTAAFSLAACLAWQALLGRSLRAPTATAAYRRPQAPPPLPPPSEERMAKVAPEDESGDLVGSKV